MTVASRLVNTGMRQLAHQAETLVPGRLGLCPINTQRITACTNAPIYYAVFQAEQARNASLMRSLPQFKEMVPVTAPATAFFSEGEQVFKSLAGERKAAYQQLCMALGANALMVAPPKPSMVLVTAPATAFFSEGEQVFKSLAGERKAAYQQLYMAPGANALMVAPKPSWMDSGSLSPEVCENLTQLYSRRVSPDLVEEYDASNEQRPDESSSSVPSEAMKDHRFLMSPDGPPPYYGVTLEQSANCSEILPNCTILGVREEQMQKLKNAMHSGANAATAQVERIRLAVEPVVFQSQLAAYSALGTAMNTGERLVGVAQLAKDAGVVTAHQGMQAVKDGVEDAKQAVELVADQAKLRVYSAMGTALDANESLVNGFKFAQDSARYSSFGNAVIGAGVFIGATGLVWAGVREHSKRKEAKAVEQAAADQAAAGPVVLDANTFMPQGVVGGRSIARELQDLARSKLEGGALDELSILNPSGKTQAPCTQLTALTGGVPFEKFALSGPERTIWAQICKVAEGVFELLTGNY